MYTTMNLSVQGLMTELMAFSQAGEEGPFVIQIVDVVHNPHSALGIYDTIKLFPKVDIRIALLCGNSCNALVIAAAVDKEKRYATATGMISFSRARMMGQGAYKDLKIAVDAQDEVNVRMDTIVDKAYSFENDTAKMIKDEQIIRMEEVLERGNLRPIEELLV